MFEQFKNKDGTYNGAKALSSWSGLSYEEVAWTAKRMKQLMHEEKKTKAEAMAMVKEEAKNKPWQDTKG